MNKYVGLAAQACLTGEERKQSMRTQSTSYRNRVSGLVAAILTLAAVLPFAAEAQSTLSNCDTEVTSSEDHAARESYRSRIEVLGRFDEREPDAGEVPLGAPWESKELDRDEDFVAQASLDDEVLDAVREPEGPVVFVARGADEAEVLARTTGGYPEDMRGTIRVVQSCISLADLEAASQAAQRLGLAGDEVVAFGYSWFSDRIVARTNLPAEDVRSRFGLPSNKLTVVEFGPDDTLMTRASRTSDAAPHRGGAEISSGGSTCSSFFSLVKPNGTRYSATADHCPVSVYVSGAHAFNTSNWRPNFPARDMQRLANSTYTDNVYSQNNNTTEGDVKSGGNPGNGYTYCNYGSQTRKACFVQDQSGQQFCDALGCTTDLAIATENYTISRGGDSGGPVAKVLSPGHAARGMVVAQIEGYLFGDYINTIYYHITSDVEATLSASILTVN